MCDGLPKNKWTLGLAAFAFAFAVCGRIIQAGCARVSVGEGDQTNGDRQGAQHQSYGQIAFHVTFLL